MTRTLVSSSPPLKILPLEYLVVLESNQNQLVNVLSVKSREKTCICHSDKYRFSPTEGGHVTFAFHHTCLIMHVSNSMIMLNSSSYILQ